MESSHQLSETQFPHLDREPWKPVSWQGSAAPGRPPLRSQSFASLEVSWKGYLLEATGCGQLRGTPESGGS